MVVLDIDEDDDVEEAMSLIATTSMIYEQPHGQRVTGRKLKHPALRPARNPNGRGRARSG
jgi:hypothetical protein